MTYYHLLKNVILRKSHFFEVPDFFIVQDTFIFEDCMAASKSSNEEARTKLEAVEDDEPECKK